LIVDSMGSPGFADTMNGRIDKRFTSQNPPLIRQIQFFLMAKLYSSRRIRWGSQVASQRIGLLFGIRPTGWIF
jgi:hypothetical protein